MTDFLILAVVAAIVTAILLSLVLIGAAVLMFTGNLEATLGEDALTVKASFSSDLVVRYEDVDAIEYREGSVDGERIYGVGSARLLLGSFRNEEFGTYTRYTYTGDAPCVVMTVKGKTVVVSTGDEATTRAIYERISAEIAE